MGLPIPCAAPEEGNVAGWWFAGRKSRGQEELALRGMIGASPGRAIHSTLRTSIRAHRELLTVHGGRPRKRKPGVRSRSDRLREARKCVVSSDQHPSPNVGLKMPPAPTGNTHMERVLPKLPQQIAFASAATVCHGMGRCAARFANNTLLLCRRKDRQSGSP